MTNQVTIKKLKGDMNMIQVNMTISAGKLLAIMHALEVTATPVGQDILFLLRQANHKPNGDPIIQ